MLLCHSQDLAEGQASGFCAEGQSLIAVRRQGRVYAYRNRCPHRQVPLNWLPDDFLDPSASLLRCAHHGALFLIEEGECVSGPCAGKELERMDVEENAEGIWLRL